MHYRIELAEQPTGGWMVAVWDDAYTERLYAARLGNEWPVPDKEVARDTGVRFVQHHDSSATYTINERAFKGAA